MASIKENNLELNYGWPYGESGWNSGMDENIVKLGFESRKRINGILSSPPLSPSNGDAYIIGTSPTGLFSGKFANIAIYDRNSWIFIVPKSQEVVFNAQNGCDYIFKNGWVLKPVENTVLTTPDKTFVEVKGFDFTTGYTITDLRQVLYNPLDGYYYQWSGPIPKVITAELNPVTYTETDGAFTKTTTVLASGAETSQDGTRILSFCSTNDTGYVSGNTIAYFKVDHAFTFPNDFAGSQAAFTVRPPAVTNAEIALIGIYVNNTRIGSVQFGTDNSATFVMYLNEYTVNTGDIISFKVDIMTYIGSFTLTLVHTLGA